MVHIAVEVVVSPPIVVVVLPPYDPLPLHNTIHMFSHRVGHMRDNIYLLP